MTIAYGAVVRAITTSCRPNGIKAAKMMSTAVFPRKSNKIRLGEKQAMPSSLGQLKIISHEYLYKIYGKIRREKKRRCGCARREREKREEKAGQKHTHHNHHCQHHQHQLATTNTGANLMIVSLTYHYLIPMPCLPPNWLATRMDHHHLCALEYRCG